jgi:hypothetical protein
MDMMEYVISLEGDFNIGLEYVVYIDGKWVKRMAEYPSQSQIESLQEKKLMSDIEVKIQYIKNKYCKI